ncbi:MAG TPA: kinase, partial [Arenimonas sp.]|nr:kinase [Arenimonas sp.]
SPASQPNDGHHHADFIAARLAQGLELPARVPVLGLTGLQGTGKSTLAADIATMARRRGLPVVVLSIDDFYLGRRERQRLARQVHPLLGTRGPPGSHDLDLLLETLEGLRSGRRVALPRFDKIDDRRLPPSRWPRSPAGTRLVVFEGWFHKVPPEDEAALVMPVNALERDEDPDGCWRRHCNQALPGYAPAWALIDHLTWLRGPGFDVVPRWRWQQECTLQAANPGRAAMSRAQVDRFVLFFERTSRQAQRTLPGMADEVIELDADRRPIS